MGSIFIFVERRRCGGVEEGREEEKMRTGWRGEDECEMRWKMEETKKRGNKTGEHDA